MRGIDYWYIRPSIRRPPTGEKQKSCQFFKNLTALYVCGHAEPAAALPPHGQQHGTGASFRTSPGPEIIPTRLRVLSHSYFSPYCWRISVRFLSFCFVFLCILCVLSPFGTVLVSKFGINFLKNRRRKNPLFFLSN